MDSSPQPAQACTEYGQENPAIHHGWHRKKGAVHCSHLRQTTWPRLSPGMASILAEPKRQGCSFPSQPLPQPVFQEQWLPRPHTRLCRRRMAETNCKWARQARLTVKRKSAACRSVAILSAQAHGSRPINMPWATCIRRMNSQIPSRAAVDR